LGERVQELEKGFADDWKKCGQLVAAVGRAYGELGKFEQAINRYEKALKVEDASLPLNAVEQLCNFQSRAAINKRLAAPSEALKLLDQAEKRLEGLIEHCGITSERRGLRGSIAKRRALLAKDRDSKRKALEAMGEAYRDQASPGNGSADTEPYTLFNALSAVVLSGLLAEKPSTPRELDKQLKVITDAAADRDRKFPSFWNAVIEPDCLLLKHLAKRSLDEAATDVVTDAYLNARKRDASPREFRSVLDQLEFYANVLASAPNEKINREMVNALGTVGARLGSGQIDGGKWR
jgi:tetratricopeptide (TPR) repeat protein